MNSRIVLLSAAMALALCACDKSSNDTASSSAPAATPATAATPAAAPAPAPAATPAAPAAAGTAAPVAASGDKIGIPECDDYVSKVQACVSSKVPEAQRAMMASAFKQQTDAFKQAAANPATKDALASQCKQALDQAKATYTSFGCSL